MDTSFWTTLYIVFNNSSVGEFKIKTTDAVCANYDHSYKIL